MNMIDTYNRGDVYWCDLPAYSKTILTKTRPCLILSNDIANIGSNTVIICPLTRRLKKPELPCHVVLNDYDMVKLEQILTIEKASIHGYVKTLSYKEMRAVNAALLIELGFI